MKSLTDCTHENMKREKVSDTIPLVGRMVELKDAPALVCENCGEIHYEGRYLLDLEKRLTTHEDYD
jgi:YgiT-type zinc finger domain-containing protein